MFHVYLSYQFSLPFLTHTNFDFHILRYDVCLGQIYTPHAPASQFLQRINKFLFYMSHFYRNTFMSYHLLYTSYYYWIVNAFKTKMMTYTFTKVLITVPDIL